MYTDDYSRLLFFFFTLFMLIDTNRARVYNTRLQYTYIHTGIHCTTDVRVCLCNWCILYSQYDVTSSITEDCVTPVTSIQRKNNTQWIRTGNVMFVHHAIRHGRRRTGHPKAPHVYTVYCVYIYIYVSASYYVYGTLPATPMYCFRPSDRVLGHHRVASPPPDPCFGSCRGTRPSQK